MGPRAPLDVSGKKKYLAHAWNSFYFFTWLSCPYSLCFAVCTVQHTTLTSIPLAGFFLYSLVLSLYFIRTCFLDLILLHFAFCLYLTTHNTNIQTPGGIRTRNPSKRLVADPRLRKLGHWDRQLLKSGTHSHYPSRYTDWATVAGQNYKRRTDVSIRRTGKMPLAGSWLM